MTFKSKVAAGFGFALAILLCVSFLSYRSVEQGNNDRRWVMHTHQVLEALDAVLANILDVESGVRGYVLLGDKSFLGAYSAALTQVGQNVKKVRELTVDNPVQQESL